MLWCNGRVALALLVAAAGILTAACMAESHGVRIATLAAVARTAIEARPNMAVPDGTYVHATGTPAVTKPSVDPATGIESAAVAMRRTGRIFQWTELRRIIGKGAIRIDHVKQWTSTVVDTTGFSRKGYQNVGRLDLTTDIFRGGVQLAGLTVGEGLLGALDDRWQARPLTRAEFEGVPETVRSGFNLVGGELSRGGEEEIGAARVSYQIVVPREVSVVGRVMNGRIEPFLLDGDSIGIFVEGRKTLDQMLWEEAWPSLVKLLLAAVVSLIFLALPLLAAYDSVVENRASRT